MGKEKITEEIVKTSNMTNMLIQYAPLILGLICLIICYLLFKKIQSLNSQGDSVSKIEKQFTNFIKEQSEINTVSSKKFNAMISQINQLSYIVQNSNVKETNSMDTQLSPERLTQQAAQQQAAQQQAAQQQAEQQQAAQQQAAQQQAAQQQEIKQPLQRELMPTSVIQTNFPINQESKVNIPSNPVVSTIKKEIINDNLPSIDEQKSLKQGNKNKKVIDLQTLKEEVLIEEASSDDDE